MNILTEEQKMAVAEFAAYQNGGTADEYIDDIVSTSETVTDFANIAESSTADDMFGDGYILRRVQRRKGDQRSTIYIIDFGTVRGLYEI